ncbi:MBL fold metallo-hydrolase [Agrococcus beijingensis]|uniref:MBL fold metallo-hydrolase n=1 Tax=Agrococcus beijingensis TaxID=3068634 RepID=UPI0027407758|nr:MBL fold metallo-hydrolase [Agrococcus sp. REN33]
MTHTPTLGKQRRGLVVQRRQALLERDVAPGVHRLQHASTNAYLIEEGGAVTLVDALFPASRVHLDAALAAMGRTIGDVRGLVLTHAHFDHLGMAASLHDAGMPIWVHDGDRYIAAHPYRYRSARSRLWYPLRYPGSVPLFAAMVSVGALSVRGVEDAAALEPDGVLDLPGRPRVVPTPGHTDGHVALHMADRDAVISGDALVTLDPYTTRTGPRVVAGAATVRPEQALASLDALEATGASAVLPGHGDVWRDGVVAAVREARAAGVD